MKENEIHFIDRTITHIRRVQDNMILLEKNRKKLPFKIDKWQLIKTGLLHDYSKFHDHLVDGFVKLNELYRAKRLGLKTDVTWEEVFPYIEEHRKIEYHHAYNKQSMIPLHQCEMCCDLAAVAQEFSEEDYTKYFKETLIKEAPVLELYKKDCIRILKLLQELNTKE